jgi:predicted RND superfamily exporter protein
VASGSSSPLAKSVARLLTRLTTRRAGSLTLASILLGIAGGYYSTLLYKNLRTDIEELLPTTARSVLDLDEVTRRLESIENIGVVVLSEKPKESRQFIDALAAELSKEPRDKIAGLEYRIDRELKFFGDRKALYMELSDLKQVRDYIHDRIEYEKELYNPLNIFSGREIPEPRLEIGSLERKYSSRISSYSRFPDGYYATPDGKVRILLVHLPGKASGVAAATDLRRRIDAAILRVDPARYDPALEIKFTGGVQNLLEEHHALIEDLELSTVIVMILVTGVLILFFRTIRATLLLVAALLIGTLWTFGVSYFAVGYLNANSAFLGAIVLGNGINFGIMMLARYLEERRKGVEHESSLQIAMESTLTGTWTAALAAGLAYGSLILTGFRGFKQFGVIGFIGMVLCWIATFTVLPAFLTLADRMRPLVRPGAASSRNSPADDGGWIARFLGMLISRYPGWIWGGTVALTIFSGGVMLLRYSPDILETDTSRLRDRRSMESGSVYNARYQDQVFERYLSPLVIMPRKREDAIEIAARLKEIQRLEGKQTQIASVQTIDDFLPRDQREKIRVLQDIERLLPPRILKELSPEDRERVSTFFKPECFKEVLANDLPALIRDRFTERDGSFGNLVVVEPPLRSRGNWEGNQLMHLIGQLRSTADAVAPGSPVAGSLAVTADILIAISRDGPRATLFAVLAVVLLVITLFRNFETVALTLLSLFIGMIWMGGAIFGFWLKINFLNFIALPITFGIGVDYGVNVFQRYIQEGSENITAVIRNTGGAVMLASLTTIIGYGSLLIAGNQAFVSFGKLAVLGEITCVTAAILSLPAYLVWHSKRVARRRPRP